MTTAVETAINPTFVAQATICSILSREDGQDHTMINRTHGVYHVKHPKGNEEYALTHLTWKKDFADVGDYDPQYTRRTNIERRKEFMFDARQIAEDICKQINENAAGSGSFFGVFVCAGEAPTKEELDSARKRLESYFMQTIAAADAQWSANPRHDLISGVAKRGARYLKIERDWLSTYQQMAECPACGSRIKPNVAVCKSCNAILDRKKAEQFGLVDKEPKEPKPKTI